MAQQVIDIGTVPNDGTGDTLRDAGDKANDNFTELYTDWMPKSGGTFTGDIVVPDEAYDATTWNGSLEAPTKNAVRDKIEDILDGVTFTGDIVVPAEAYGVGWNGSNEAPTKNDVYDKVEAVIAGSATVSDTAYGSGWNGDTTTAPSKNAVYDKIETVVAGGYSDEQAQDAVGTILTDTGLAVVTYSDATPSIDVNVPAASASDINTGTDTTKALTANALAGSNFGKEVVTILVSDPNGSAITTGDGKAYFRVPSTLNGMNLVAVAAAVTTVSSSGIPTVQIANVTQAADMLTTKLTIDASETDSSTAATAAVIDTGNDDVATGDMLRIDIDVAGTGAKGLMVEMQFQLP